MRSTDTTQAAGAAQLSVYRRLPRAERLAIAIAMSEDLRAIAVAGARRRSPALVDGSTAHT